MSSQLDKHLFNLKFAVKELERNSKKCEKEEAKEKAKMKKAIQKGNNEVARIHAENAIRQKNQSVNYLRMSARVDAVASRVQTAVTTSKVTNSMGGVVKAMDAAMKSMNLEKISNLMDKFESQFEDLDVQSSYMENTMSQTTTTNVPQADVDQLMQQVADEAGLLGFEHGVAPRTDWLYWHINSGFPGARRAHTTAIPIEANVINLARSSFYPSIKLA
ncbi:hypothetical protein FOCC_FOCC009319 [Frankliniella occidentalis]|nr:hypothetical protein FOCC_FOCC009319 [Frankliniella occidentalis]